MKLKKILISVLMLAGVGCLLVNAADLKTIDQSYNYNLRFSSGGNPGAVMNITGIGKSWAVFSIGSSSVQVQIAVTTQTYSNRGETVAQPAYSTSTFIVPANSTLSDDMVFNANNTVISVRALSENTTYFMYFSYGTPKQQLNLDTSVS